MQPYVILQEKRASAAMDRFMNRVQIGDLRQTNHHQAGNRPAQFANGGEQTTDSVNIVGIKNHHVRVFKLGPLGYFRRKLF